MSEPNSFEKWRDRNRAELENVLANAHAKALTAEDLQLALETVRRALEPGKPGRPSKKFRDLRKDTNLAAAVLEVEILHSQGESYESAREQVGKERGYCSSHLQKRAFMARIPKRLAATFAPISDISMRLRRLVPRFTQQSPDE
jgi:hypothetical protein